MTECSYLVNTHVGGNLPIIPMYLSKIDPDTLEESAIDLSDELIISIKFALYKKLTASTRQQVSIGDCAIDDGPNGLCSYSLQASDVSVVADMAGYVIIDYGSGNQDIFPKGSGIRVIVSAL